MPETRHWSGLLITTEPNFKSGCQTGRPWDSIVKAMVKSGELFLSEGEVVTGIAISPEYGLTFQLGRLPNGK